MLEKKLSKHDTNTIKGIAILMVILCHIAGNYTRVFTPLGGIGVALFLFISAYGLEKSFQKKSVLNQNPLKNFWYKRLITVFLPYIFFEIIRISFIQAKPSYYNLLLDFTLRKPLFQYGWYLNYLILWYIIFWIIHKLFQNPRMTQFLFCIITVILCIYFGLCNYNSLRFEQSFSFLLGILYANNESHINLFKRKNKFICNIFIFLTILIFSLGIKQVPIIRNIGYPIMSILDLIIKSISLISIIQIILFFNNLKPSFYLNIWSVFKKFIEPFGSLSFELYLIHGCTISILSKSNNLLLGLSIFLTTTILFTLIFSIINNFTKQYLTNLIK